MFSNKKGQLPTLCTELGTVPHKEVLDSHLASQMHAECVNMEKVDQLKILKFVQDQVRKLGIRMF